MTLVLLLTVGILYFITGISYYIDGNVGMAVAFFCYGLANFGLYVGSK